MRRLPGAEIEEIKRALGALDVAEKVSDVGTTSGLMVSMSSHSSVKTTLASAGTEPEAGSPGLYAGDVGQASLLSSWAQKRWIR